MADRRLDRPLFQMEPARAPFGAGQSAKVECYDVNALQKVKLMQ